MKRNKQARARKSSAKHILVPRQKPFLGEREFFFRWNPLKTWLRSVKTTLSR
jgi:hypothetical protein